MSMLLLFGLLLLNLGISAWDAYAAGRIWHDCAGFMKLVAWSALIMSACGFTSVFACLLSFWAVAQHILTENSGAIMMKLTYVMIIVPVLGAGMIITVHSWIEAWKSRRLLDVGIAGFNTYAQVSNAADAVKNMGPMLGDIFDFFKSSDDDEDEKSQGAIILFLVSIAFILAGAATFFFWRLGVKNAISLEAPQRAPA